jgi:hypothetical protein
MNALQEALSKLQLKPGAFISNLVYMGIGMIGIFIIIGVIMAATYATAYVTDKLARPSDDD